MFKKFLTITFLSSTLAFSQYQVKSTQAADENLIPNAQVQIADVSGTKPENWQTGNWGQNSATFSYLSEVSGNKYLKVSVTAYNSGDAKWYFKPITILPNTQYLFSDYYQSNVTTDFVVQILNEFNQESYLYIGSAPPSSSWRKIGFNFTTPDYAAKITVFHLIAKVGYLNTDDFSLTRYQPMTFADSIPNASLEQVSDLDSNLPAYWQTGNWGSNKATFSYLNTGHTGNRSIKVTISNRTSGDAKWYYTPQPVTAGQYYHFQDWYISNVQTEVILMVNKSDGSTLYQTLSLVFASNNWTLYSKKFIMPAGAITATIMHVIYNNGYLITDDYSLSTYVPQKFARPLITLTFDDAWDQNLITAFPILDQYGFKTTQYYCTQYIESEYDRNNIKAIFLAGHEISSHSVNHPFLTQVSTRRLNNELTKSKTILENIVGAGNVTSFATPYGDYNLKVTNAIKQYYQSNRNTDTGWNSPDDFDIYNIKVQNMTNTTTLAEFQSWVDKAITDSTWLVIVYHDVIDNPDPYDVRPADFAAQMQYIAQTGITVKTISQALSELVPQIK